MSRFDAHLRAHVTICRNPDCALCPELAEEAAIERLRPSEGTVGQEQAAGDEYEAWLDGRWAG